MAALQKTTNFGAMQGPTIFVLNHIYNRHMSYIIGVMTCRSTVNGVSLGEKLSKLTMQDLDEIGANGNPNENAYALLTAIKTSCKAMGHTDDALLLCLTIMD